MGGQPVRIPVSNVRVGSSTTDFQENSEDTHFTVEKDSNQTCNLYRRYTTSCLISGGSMSSKGHDNISTTKSGFRDKLQKVSAGTNTNIGIPGSTDKQCFNDIFCPKRESKEVEKSFEGNPRDENNPNKETSKCDRKLNGNSPSLHSSPIASEILTEMPEQSIKEKSELRNLGKTRSPSKGGIDLVAGKLRQREWENTENSTPRHDNQLRCSQREERGLGSQLWGGVNRGEWNQFEKALQINILELKAALLAIKSFTKDLKNLSLHLLLDNQVALAHVTKMGRPTNLTLLELAKEIWSYLRQKKITLTAAYIPSLQKKIADFKSRNSRDWGDWKLDSQIFQKIKQLWGTPEIDLFASRISHQLPKYYSWKPDPYCLAVDALLQDWKESLLYAFPPFCLIGRCLEKIRRSGSIKVVLIAPMWMSQPWYPTLLEMIIANPRRIQMGNRTLTHPSEEEHPLLRNNTLNLVAWKVSGDPETQKSYQKQLPLLSEIPEQKEQETVTTPPGKTLWTGAVRGRWIPLTAL